MSERSGFPERPDAGELERRYLEFLLAPDARGARGLMEEALAVGVSAAVLYLEVIAPAMTQVGVLWENARISVAQEHLATQISQSVIAALALHLTAGERVGEGRTAVVSSSPGELHALGTRMVADFLEAQGWEVLALGQDTPAHDLLELSRARGASLVALSTALPGRLPSVTRACQLLRGLEPAPFIVVGGRAYRGDEALARSTGADAFAADPRTLLGLLSRTFAPAPAG